MSAPSPVSDRDPAKARPRRRLWSLIGLLVPATITLAVLIALGTWQLQRKAWKEALIATLDERLAAPPEPLPPPATWPTLDRDDAEYRRPVGGHAIGPASRVLQELDRVKPGRVWKQRCA